MNKRRVAVVGSGISGLSVAWSLAKEANVTLFEADDRFGGHAHTVDLTLEGITHGVDTGFLVYNERTYPELIRLFETLRVRTAKSDMSFSVQSRAEGLEWNGATLNTVFAQRRNVLRPRFWWMLRDILRFNRLATELAEQGAESALQEPIADFLERQGFNEAFRDWYLLPMIGCIWSCPTEQMLQFPIATLIRFCHNHGLIQVNNRPQWHTVVGGSREYVRRMINGIPDARSHTPVKRVRRLEGVTGPRWAVTTEGGESRYDEVVLACHTDQSQALVGDANPALREWLSQLRYQPNRAVLHTDARLMPRSRRAWAAWNYERAPALSQEQTGVCLHYWLNRLQPLPWKTPVFVSLNPAREPDPATVIREFSYDHPVFDLKAIQAQQRLAEFQGRDGLWLAGAWTRYGFHEDGLMSGLAVVEGLRQAWAQTSPAFTDSAAALPLAA
jgi:uncharacterized protein